MNRRLRTLLPAVLAVPLFLTACGSEVTDLPAGLGPVALTTDLALPAACDAATGAGAYVIGDARSYLANPSYSERKARGCVPYSLADIWKKLQVPTGVDLAFWPEHTETDCEAWLAADPEYPLSFITKEIPHGGLEKNYPFEVTWRIGVSQGTATAPTEVKILYGKTSGTTMVPKILGSVVLTADPAHPGWTRLDLVRQINTGGWSNEPEKLNNWLQAFYDGLQTQMSTGSLTPRYCVLP